MRIAINNRKIRMRLPKSNNCIIRMQLIIAFNNHVQLPRTHIQPNVTNINRKMI